MTRRPAILPPGPVPRPGVGLRNASERLKLLFGERATLHLLSAEPMGCVTADVCIPLKPATA